MILPLLVFSPTSSKNDTGQDCCKSHERWFVLDFWLKTEVVCLYFSVLSVVEVIYGRSRFSHDNSGFKGVLAGIFDILAGSFSGTVQFFIDF